MLECQVSPLLILFYFLLVFLFSLLPVFGELKLIHYVNKS